VTGVGVPRKKRLTTDRRQRRPDPDDDASMHAAIMGEVPRRSITSRVAGSADEPVTC
jgi:hypothetical protein